MHPRQRLSIFCERLNKAPRSISFDMAWDLLHATMNAVEDEFSGVPFNPMFWEKDGRLYPPEFDAERKCTLKGVRMFRSRGHRLFIAANGAIRIASVVEPLDISVDIPGKDGKRCPS